MFIHADRKKGTNILDHTYYGGKMASKLAARWRDIGTQLDFETSELDAISETNHADNRCKEMLNKWLQTDDPTWNNLYKAIRTVERNAAAEDMKKAVMKLYS